MPREGYICNGKFYAISFSEAREYLFFIWDSGFYIAPLGIIGKKNLTTTRILGKNLIEKIM